MEERSAVHEGAEFTDFVRSLIAAAPAPRQVEAILGLLWRALRWELKRRGLWDLPPSYLGVYGLAAWSQAEGRDEKNLPGLGLDLVSACYQYVFIDRLSYMARQLEIRPNIDGLVYRNVRHFVHDTQRKHDPLGFRIFQMARGAVLEEIAEEGLQVVKGSPRIRNQTVLAFAGVAADVATSEALAGWVTVWNDVLLPDLVTARGKKRLRVQAFLRHLLAQLPARGINAFRFGDLIGTLKTDVRRRWASLYDIEEGPDAVERLDTDGEELRLLVRQVAPDTSLEDRQTYDQLVRCVDARLERLHTTPAVGRDLGKLWQFLRLFAASADAPSVDERQGETLPAELPSRRRLAQELGIPKNQMSKIFSLLGELVTACQRPRQSEPGAKAAMNTDQSDGGSAANVVAELCQKTAEARGRIELEVVSRDRGQRAVGDRFLSEKTADHGVEWVLVEQGDLEGSAWQAAPADTNPLVGSSDLAVDVSEPGGPLTLRCAHPVRMPEEELARSLWIGALGAEACERLRHQWRLLAEGEPETSELTREVDEDPEYEAWVEEVTGPARDAWGPAQTDTDISTAEPATVLAMTRPAISGRRSLPLALAASLLLALLVGRWGLVELERKRLLQAARQPTANALLVPLVGETIRSGGVKKITVPEDATQIVLVAPIPASGILGRIEMLDRTDESIVLRQTTVPDGLSDWTLVVPLTLMTPDGRLVHLSGGYRIQLYSASGTPLNVYDIEIERP